MAEGPPRERSCAKKGLAQVRCLQTFAFSEAHSNDQLRRGIRSGAGLKAKSLDVGFCARKG